MLAVMVQTVAAGPHACAGLRDSGNATSNADQVALCVDSGLLTIIYGLFPVDRGIIIGRAGVTLRGFGNASLCNEPPCDQLQYVGPVTTSSLLTVSGPSARISDMWLNGNSRIGALSGEAVVVSFGAPDVLVQNCKLTGATYPSPYVWQTGNTRDWVAAHPALADSAAPGTAFADSGSATITLGSGCTLGSAGCYSSASAAAGDPRTKGYRLAGTDLVEATVKLFADAKADPIVEDDHIRRVSWGYANGGGAAPLGTVVVAGWGFVLEDSYVGHALQGFNLCGTKDVVLRRNRLGLTGCDTIVLCGTATNLTLDSNTFCGAGYFCPNSRGKRSENMVGLHDLSGDAVPSSLLNYIPAAGETTLILILT